MDDIVLMEEIQMNLFLIISLIVAVAFFIGVLFAIINIKRKNKKMAMTGCIISVICLILVIFIPIKRIDIDGGGWDNGQHYYNIIGMEIYHSR